MNLLTPEEAARAKNVTRPAILYQLRRGRLGAAVYGCRRFIVRDQRFEAYNPIRWTGKRP